MRGVEEVENPISAEPVTFTNNFSCYATDINDG